MRLNAQTKAPAENPIETSSSTLCTRNESADFGGINIRTLGPETLYESQ